MKFFIFSFLSLVITTAVSGQLVLDDIVNSFNGPVHAIEVDEARGIGYFGGEFTTYHPSYNGGDIFDRVNHQPTRTLPWMPYVDHVVDDGQGGWIVATDYVEGIDVSTQQNYQFIHVDADGNTEALPFFIPSTSAGFEVDGMIRMGDFLVAYDVYTLYVFNWVEGVQLPVEFDVNETGYISSLYSHNDTLYITGSFETVNGLPRRLICSYDVASWQLTDWWLDLNELYPSTTDYTNCDAMVSTENHFYFVIVSYYYMGSTLYQRIRVMKLLRSTGEFIQELPAYDFESLKDLTASNTRVFLAGSDNVNGTTMARLISIPDELGEVSYEQIEVMETVGTIDDLLVKDEVLYVNGWFSEMFDQERVGVAFIHAPTFMLTNETLPFNGIMYAVGSVVPSGNQLFIASSEGPMGGYEANHFARINLYTGEIIPTSVEIIGNISDMELTSTGDTLFIAGSEPVTDVFGSTYLAALNTVEETFIPWTVTSPSITQIDIVRGSLFLQFNNTSAQVNGQGRSRIASFNLQTLALEPIYFNIDAGISSFDVRNDTLLVCGGFSTINAVQRRDLAMLNANTFSVLPWDANIGNQVPSEYAYALQAKQALFYGNHVLSGGFFQGAEGYTQNSGVAMYDVATGARAPGYQFPILGNIYYLRSFQLRENRLYLSGAFANSSSPARGDIAAMDMTTGTYVDLGIDAASFLLATIDDVEFFGDKMICGGEYPDLNGETDLRNCSSWDLGCSPGRMQLLSAVSYCAMNETSVVAAWQQSEPELYEWEMSADSGATWMDLQQNTAQLLLTDDEYAGTWIRVQGLSSCDTTYSNVAVVEQQTMAALNAVASGAEVCQFSPMVLNAGVPVQWSNGAVSGTPFQANILGENEFVATSTEGCFAPDTVIVFVNSLPQLNYLIVDSLSCDGDGGTMLLQATGGQAPYVYQFNGSNINAFVPQIMSNSGYTVRDANYCTASTTIVVPYSSSCYGCTDPAASNYNPQSVFDEGCEYLFTSCDYDLSGDGVINVADLTVLLNNFGCVGLDCESDLDGDQVVGVNDIYFIIQFFNYSCE